MKQIKKNIVICVVFLFSGGLISGSQNRENQYILEHESVEKWANSMDSFFKKFLHQAKFARLVKPITLKEKEVTNIFFTRLKDSGEYDVHELSRHFLFLCKKYRFDPALILSVVFVESSFNPRAISPAGARGLMQIMPETAQDLASRNGFLYESADDLYDPFLSLTLGIHYLAYLRGLFENNLYLTLMAYNMGPNRMIRQVSDGLERNFSSELGRHTYYERIINALEKFNFES